jgi:hypothetical protein
LRHLDSQSGHESTAKTLRGVGGKGSLSSAGCKIAAENDGGGTMQFGIFDQNDHGRIRWPNNMKNACG